MNHIKFLKERIIELQEELKSNTEDSEYNDYLFNQLCEYEAELKEKESYQYLEDNDIEY